MSLEGQDVQQILNEHRSKSDILKQAEVGWCDSQGTLDEIRTKLQMRQEGDLKRERTIAYALSQQDEGTAANKGTLRFEGMADIEVERKLKDIVPAFSIVNSIDPRFSTLYFVGSSSTTTVPQPSPQGSVMSFHDQQLQQQPQALPSFNPVGRVGPLEASLQNIPAREEGEVPELELDPDTRRRLLILQNGQYIREHPPKESPPFPVRPPAPPVPGPPIQSHGNWFPPEEETIAHSGDKPTCQICHKYGHAADECLNMINFSSPGKAPPKNLHAMLATANILGENPWYMSLHGLWCNRSSYFRC